MKRKTLVLVTLLLCGTSWASAGRLRVGVTTHSYYSWVARLVEGVPVEVVPLIPEGADPHVFAPRPEDIRRIAAIDVLVAGGIGHDAFADRLLKAAGKSAVSRIDIHQGVPLIPYHPGLSHSHGESDKREKNRAVNPHTFLSVAAAIQQIYNLRKGLERLLPAHRPLLRANTRRYARTLRLLKAQAARRLVGAAAVRIATVHDGYSYLLQEFGLKIMLVIQPRHGIEPSARELAAAIEAIGRARVRVLFAESDFPRKYVDVIVKATGVELHHLGHISRGRYGPGVFVREMKKNLETLVRALAAQRE